MNHEQPPQKTPDTQRWRKVRHSVGAAGYLLAAAFGGVGANAASESSVEVGSWYQVDAGLDPTSINQVQIDTSINPIFLRPNTPTFAPGVKILPHLQPNVIDNFINNGNKLTGIEPSQPEVIAALEDLARQMGIKFAAGALGAAVLYGFLLNSHRLHAYRKIAAGATVGTIGASLALVGGMYSSYNPNEQWSVQTEGILAEAYANRDLFNDISKQSSALSSKVGAILQLVNSIEATGDTEAPGDDIRFLLVSDIHGMDISPILQNAIKQYHVDAVLFSGDLLNYGTVGELEASGILAGIESLDVPFIAVMGNHDKTSPIDTDVLARLQKVPNVVLLQPDNTNYTTISVGGVVIGGFNDPRNGFDGQIASEPEEQQAAAKEFMAAVPLKSLDIVVAHENLAAKPVAEAASEQYPVITINGHGHRLDLHETDKGVNIEVGSATAGGLTNPGRYNPEGKDIKDISDPNLNSFDILTFGTDCMAKQLTRIQYTIDAPRQVITKTIPFTIHSPSDITRVCTPNSPNTTLHYNYRDTDNTLGLQSVHATR